MSAICHIRLSKIKKIEHYIRRWGPTCIIVPNFIKIGRTVAEIWRFNGFFQNGGCPISWICWAIIKTTHDYHLVVSIVTPNLVKVDAIVSITLNFQYFARLAGKCILTPPKLGFSGVFTPKMGSSINETRKRHTLAESASFEPSSVKIRRRV